jgi:2-isopropylmalate synthase
MYKQGKYTQYKKKFPVTLPNRTWPDKDIEAAPIWCSVDLRDGNQALINPMNLEQKLAFFSLLVDVGFKEIEISFPSAANVEFDFTRKLIEESLIPSDVTPQVLVQAREHLIRRTFESLIGAKRAILHLYNSTSELQRRVVFKKDKREIIELALSATRLVKQLAEATNTEIVFQYSPESFTGTEIEFARDICEAVKAEWGATPARKMIINLPATVEMSTPNLYADRIEWFTRNATDRDSYILSVHTHNDRGTGIAATELALLAGADRVEGTLFGNGERTGNVDIVTLALNLLTQGIDPKLNFADLKRIIACSDACTSIPLHPRHPYAGELVFTAFSGSHQDAINKGMVEQENLELWQVPYIPIDPKDLGRNYDGVVRINSQSGKGGAAFILENEFGCKIPKEMQPEVGATVQKISEVLGTEVPSQALWEGFCKEFIDLKSLFNLIKVSLRESIKKESLIECELSFNVDEGEVEIVGIGNGPIEAAIAAINENLDVFKIADKEIFIKVNYFSQRARTSGADAEAVTFIELDNSKNQQKFGVGINKNTSVSSIEAIISACNRLFKS